MIKSTYHRKLLKCLLIWAALSLNSFVSAQVLTFPATDKAISFQGRTVPNAGGAIELISSASLAGFQFEGDSCIIQLRNITAPGDYNYVALELDGEYMGRLKVSGTELQNSVINPVKKKAWHTLRIYKATEAANGVVLFQGVKASDLKPLQAKSNLKIEFIGNSITCGMGNDLQLIPCGSDKWYDQHNAYWSYASITARMLGADFMLSSISGAGIYRNWNSNGPTVPQQYESAYLHTDSLKEWDFSAFIPDIVLVALGTNDLSNGDGKSQRAPFDSTTFIREYISFVGNIYRHYHNAELILLTSPMISDERSEVLYICLQSVQKEAAKQFPGQKEIRVFRFNEVPSTGCSGHPTIEEHKMMAAQLQPYLKDQAAGLKQTK
jgi:lysophospholipase L1-like esterase